MKKLTILLAMLGMACVYTACGGSDDDGADDVNPAIKTDGRINGHSYVEIGGLKWATMNVGATTIAGSPSTCYGDYFAWGETEPRYTSLTISDTNTFTIAGWKEGFSTGYLSTPQYYGYVLDAEHDAATQNWGTAWRTPTSEEFKTLCEACGGSTSMSSRYLADLSTSEPTGGIYKLSSYQNFLPEYKGVAGILFVDRGDTSKRVFLPAAGFIEETRTAAGSSGHYWSSSLHNNNTAYNMYFYYSSEYAGKVTPTYPYFSHEGYSVRPVSD